MALCGVLLWASLLHCSSVPSYERAADETPLPEAGTPPQPGEDSGGARDAGGEGGPAADGGCQPTPFERTPPGEEDRCRYAVPLGWSTGALRFGALDTARFALTPQWLYVVAGGKLKRLPRSIWLTAGGDTFEQCAEVALGDLSAGSLRALVPWETDGVCALSQVEGRYGLACAGPKEAALRPIAAFAGEDAGMRGVRGFATIGDYVVWVHEGSADVVRYSRASGSENFASVAVAGTTLGPFSTTNGYLMASAFCGECNADFVAYDVQANNSGQGGATPWPTGSGEVRAYVRFDAETQATLFLGLTPGGEVYRVWRSTSRLEKILDGVYQLTGPRERTSGAMSFAATVGAPADAGIANSAIVTSALPGQFESDLRRAPAQLNTTAHAMQVQGEDLFVASMPVFGCGESSAWIAKLPRILP